MWPALAVRCRRALPARLSWAAALLDPERPLAVICGEPQVREFFHWLESLPNTERVGPARRLPPPGATCSCCWCWSSRKCSSAANASKI